MDCASLAVSGPKCSDTDKVYMRSEIARLMEALQDSETENRSLKSSNANLAVELRLLSNRNTGHRLSPLTPAMESVHPSFLSKSGYRFSSDGVVAFCENPGSVEEKWSTPLETTLPEDTLLSGGSQFASFDDEEDGETEPYTTLWSAISVAQTAVRQCQIMKARLSRPMDKTIEILEGKLTAHELRLKEALRYNDKKHEAKAASAKQENQAVLERLREMNARLVGRLLRGVDEARLRNEANTRERALQKRIRELEHEKAGVEARVIECQDLVANNRVAGSKQRVDLKQARRDLVDFEIIKERLMELEASIRNRSEIVDMRTKLEADVERQRRMVRSERVRSDAAMARMRKELDERITSLEAAFEALRVEFFDRVGYMPETCVLEPRCGSDED